MSLGSPKRVHIAPLGYEKERIYRPAIDESADEVVLLTHAADEDDEQAADCRNAVEQAFDDSGIKYETRECDFFTLEVALAEFQALIQQHQGDSVYINISTGSKITAIAGMLACMISGGTPYYVKPEDYGETTVSEGVENTFPVAAYPIDPPERETTQVLQFIKNRNEEEGKVIKRDLNQFIADEELGPVSELEREDSNDIYDVVQREFIKPLKENGLIQVQRLGTEKRLNLTEQGEQMLDFSNYILRE